MRTWSLLAATLVLLASNAPADVHFQDIDYWVGSGSQEAALVVDWHDDPSDALVWGFRFDGPTTGQDMFEAVVGADPRLTSSTSNFGTPETPNLFINALSFDADLSGTPTEPGDHHRDNVVFGTWWSYWGALETGPVTTWTEQATGMSDRVLTNGEVDGWSWDSDWNTPAPEPTTFPVAASAIPEPASAVLLLAGAAALIMRRKP